MDNIDKKFHKMLCEASREDLLVVWAMIMCCDYIEHDAETDTVTANCRNGFTNGEKKRTIHRCRIAQSALRRKGDADEVAAFERVISFIRHEIMSGRG